jgi:hypothetical protein
MGALAAAGDPAVALVVNPVGGKVPYEPVALAHGLVYVPVAEALA